MATLRTYTVKQDALDALNQRPNLSKSSQLGNLRLGESTTLEIVRVLNNLHYSHLRILADKLEDGLPFAGDIGRKLLQADHPSAFEHALAEFLLFVHLRAKMGSTVEAVSEKSAGRHPDILVTGERATARIEVYSPSDFTGNQEFERELTSRLKRLRVSFGYRLSVEVTVPFGPEHLGYAATMPHESIVPTWADAFQREVETWVANASSGDRQTFEGPRGSMSPKNGVSIRLILEEISDDPMDRHVGILHPTKSTSTDLFFEVGDAETTARSLWGGKLSAKLDKQQAGNQSADGLRILIVNFALSDPTDRDFFCKPHIAKRFAQTIKFLVKDSLPYDVVIPAHLGLETGFGVPVILDEERRTEIESFILKAGLDVLIAPYDHEDGLDIDLSGGT